MKKYYLIFLMCVSFLISSCGVKKDPIPPHNKLTDEQSKLGAKDSEAQKKKK